MIDKIKTLCQAFGVSGQENSASQVALTYLNEYANESYIDDFNNVIGFINYDKSELPILLLDAHIDEIGMIVTYIDDKGFLKVNSCGGLDRRLLAAQEVTVHGKQDVYGIIGSKPPHLIKAEEAKKSLSVDDLFIDIGYTKEKAQEIISLGDRVSINGTVHSLLNDRVVSKAMDNRISVISILHALNILKGKQLPFRIAVLFSSQEEIGAAGAKVSAFKIEPDYCITVDVSYGFTSDAKEHKCGKLGDGPMIGYAAILNKQFCDTLVSISKEHEIPFQYEVMGRNTGTNADSIITTKQGVKTGLISIPLKYMHTPIECVHLKDVENTSKLIAEFVLKGEF